MYKYVHPTPIVISLKGEEGYRLRLKAVEYMDKNKNTTGAERGSYDQQSYGALAEIVIRNKLGMPEINPKDHPLGFDILLSPAGLKLDVKCRGGKMPFLEEYIGPDGLPREAKHNLFARQLYADNLDAEIFLMTHLRVAGAGKLPGTPGERNWELFVGGWVSKKRILREGVYLPRGSITERLRDWFSYRGEETEFYNRNLNGLADIKDLLKLDQRDVESDENRKGELNLTKVDTMRIGYDLAGRGIINPEQLKFIERELGLKGTVGSILHANQSLHVLKWMHEEGAISDSELMEKEKLLTRVEFSGL